jgi:hypothetical protein
MRFDKGIATKYTDSINRAFEVVIAKGNKTQKYIAKIILESDMIICVFPVSKVNASGICGVTNPTATNKRIARERLTLHDAFAEVFLTFAEETIDNGGQRGCEGTLVHESRHAFDFAQAIASFSKADTDLPFNPTLYELEMAAHKTAGDYMIQIGKPDYLQEGLDLLVLGELDGNIYVNEKGIKRRLLNSYNLIENEREGLRITEMTGLKMRN